MDMTQPQDDARVTEDWLLTDSGETVYTLMPAGWRKGVEQHKNRYWFTVYADPSEGDGAARAMAECIHALLNIPAPEEGEQRGGVEAIADIIETMVSGPEAAQHDPGVREAHRQDQINAARAIIALRPAPNPQPQIGETPPASDEAAKGEVERVLSDGPYIDRTERYSGKSTAEHLASLRAPEARDAIRELVEALKAAKGRLLNVQFGLEAGDTKKSAIATAKRGARLIDEALARLATPEQQGAAR